MRNGQTWQRKKRSRLVSRSLTEADKLVFYRLGIPDELLARARIVRCSAQEASAEFGLNTEGDDAIVFPYFLPNGNGHHVTSRARLVAAKDNKYRTPYGDNRHLYFTPCDHSWMEKPETPVILAEAEKSGLAILRWAEEHQHPFLPIALGGCDSWRGRIGKTSTAEGARIDEKGPLPDLELCRNRIVYVIYDANAATNARVSAARAKLIEHLQSLLCDVRVIELPASPGVNGPDDFIGRFGDGAFFELFTTARRAARAEPTSLGFDDMPDAALDGRLGEICQKHLKDFPRSAAWIALVTAAGSLVPQSEQPYVRTNLYAALAAAPNEGKSQVNERALNLVGVKDPLLVKVFAGSAEGLVKKIGEAKDCGIARLAWVDELSHLLAKAAIDRASFPYFLNHAYYHDDVSLIVAGQKELKFRARFSLLGGIVTENFQQSFGHTTTFGLYDRFIFALWPTGFEYDFSPWDGEVIETNPCAVKIQRDVWDVRKEWKKEELGGRIFENAIRAAVVCAAWDGKPELLANELGPARAFAEYQRKVRKVLQPNPGENLDARCAFAILSLLENQNGYVKRRDVYQAINANRFGPGAFERAVTSLEYNGELVQTAKRPKLLRRIRDDEEGE